MICLGKHSKELIGTLIYLVLLWVTTLTVDNYYGKADLVFFTGGEDFE